MERVPRRVEVCLSVDGARLSDGAGRFSLAASLSRAEKRETDCRRFRRGLVGEWDSLIKASTSASFSKRAASFLVDFDDGRLLM